MNTARENATNARPNTEEAQARVILARENTETALHELYKKLTNGEDMDAYQIKEDIKSLVRAFDQVIQDEGDAYEHFDEETIEALRAALYEANHNFANTLAGKLSVWGELATDSIQALNDEINYSISEMQDVLAIKTGIINDLVVDLTDNFVTRFWEQLHEMHVHVDKS